MRAARTDRLVGGERRISHLSDAFRMAAGQKPVSPATGPPRQTIVKWIALYLPLPPPAGIPTRRELDQECGGTRPVAFAADVAELERLLERFTIETGVAPGQPHPIFGRMSEAAWLRWGYVHTDHHLRRFGA